MGKIITEITMSLDGFVAGPNISSEQPLGENGTLLHQWLFDLKTAEDEAILNELIGNTGAVIIGNRTYTTAIDGAWGGKSPFTSHAFVLTSQVQKARDGFTFVTEGINSALQKAKAEANGKDVWIMGGANVVQQFLRARLIDELTIHVAPILLINGTRLFDFIGSEKVVLKKMAVRDTPGATHLRYSVS